MSLYSRQLKWANSFQKIGKELESGKLISLFNVKDIPTFTPEYVYSITIPKNRVKGPYFHELRTTVCTLLVGEVELVYYDFTEGDYKIVALFSENPVQVVIPSKTKFCFVGKSLEALLVNVCDYPWFPESDECIVPDFSDCLYITDLLSRE